MTEAKIGQLVQVDLGGLEAPGIAFGEGVLGVGEIIDINPTAHEVSVRLHNLTISGEDVVTAPASQVAVLPQLAELAG